MGRVLKLLMLVLSLHQPQVQSVLLKIVVSLQQVDSGEPARVWPRKLRIMQAPNQQLSRKSKRWVLMISKGWMTSGRRVKVRIRANLSLTGICSWQEVSLKHWYRRMGSKRWRYWDGGLSVQLIFPTYLCSLGGLWPCKHRQLIVKGNFRKRGVLIVSCGCVCLLAHCGRIPF